MDSAIHHLNNWGQDVSALLYRENNKSTAKLKNTPQLIGISLKKNKLYCIPARSSKDAA